MSGERLQDHWSSGLISIFMNINENIKNERKIVETLRGVLTKLPISQLLTTLKYQSWYYINA